MSHVDTASSYGTDRHEPYLQIAAALAVPLANLYADAGDMPEYGDFSDGTNETRRTSLGWGRPSAILYWCHTVSAFTAFSPNRIGEYDTYYRIYWSTQVP